MDFEPIVRLLILTHAALGGIALLSGMLALLFKKGGPVHKKAGLVFYFTMLGSAGLAMFIALLPGHESPFLFGVGIFSTYFILSGYRALRFKSRHLSLRFDRLLAWIMLCAGATMILYSLLLHQTVNVVLLVFGGAGIFFAFRDLRLFRNPKHLKKNWLKLHLGKMIGGYIAAITAFVVVNNFFPGIYGWFAPSILGGFYIAFWMKKMNRKAMSKPVPVGAAH